MVLFKNILYMIPIFIKTHLKVLENTFPSNTIIVYKWFSNNFIKEIANKYDFLFDDNNKFKNWKIDLDFLKDSYKKILLSIENFSDKKVMLYEELVLLNSKNINIFDFDFSGKIIVFENSLLDYFPNESNSEFDDIEEKIDSEIDFSESIIFDFYSNFKKDIWIWVVQYKSIQDDIEYFDFYKTLNFLDINDIWEIYDEWIPNPIFVWENKKYLELLFEIYYWNVNKYKELNIVYDSNNNISTLYNVLIESWLKINLYKNTFDSYIYKFTNYREDFKSILKSFWWYDDFRKINFYKNPDISKDKIQISQWSLIEDIVTQVENAKSEKNSSDVFITAPTWAWKSIIFQVPALYLANKYKYVTIVISPLIALMNDQIQALHKKWVFNVDFINSDKSVIEREEIINKIQSWDIDILYLSPELLLSYDISHFLWDQENWWRELWLLVIDEAHLVTTWWRDFRVDYWYLWNYIRKVRKYNYNFSVLSLTATAVYGWEDDMVFETFWSLNMLNPHKYIWNVRRDDIDFKFRPFAYEWNYNIERMEQSSRVISKYATFWIKTIVYFPYTSQIREMQTILNNMWKWWKVWSYYWEMPKELKRKTQDDFLKWDITTILATKAFWMWIDINDIKIVYHHAPSWSIPDYVQEIWRLARKEDMRWIAEIDYCDKDLNYSKALHWLSSVKQYECKLVLEKINQIYTIKNNYRKKNWLKQQQNFLVSIEDFSYIFSDTASIDNKLKNILLLLEKDLLKKYKFNVIIARPKQLFTTAFISIENWKEVNFIKDYWRYVKQASTIENNKRTDTRWLTVRDVWNIYKLDLWKLWEERFLDKSFPILKKEFYENTLFEWYEWSVIPRYKLSIELNDELIATKEKIYNYFSKIETIFSNGDFYWRYATEKELEKAINSEFEDQNLAFRIKEVLLKFYCSRNDFWWDSSWLKFDTFIQERKSKKDWFTKEYRVIDLSFWKVKNAFIKKFDEIFTEKVFRKYLSYADKWDKYIKMANLIELLSLWTYEMEWWEYPQIFIRINDPYKLNKIVESWIYSNSLVSDIERRYKRSNQLIDKFFTQMENEERWDFIENYFLWNI